MLSLTVYRFWLVGWSHSVLVPPVREAVTSYRNVVGIPATRAAAAAAFVRPMPSSVRALAIRDARLTLTLAASVPVDSDMAVSKDAAAAANTSFTGSGFPN